jgi:hypothetical protein
LGGGELEHVSLHEDFHHARATEAGKDTISPLFLNWQGNFHANKQGGSAYLIGKKGVPAHSGTS